MPDEQAFPPPPVGQFQDADPEDAWSASDTVVEQLRNLVHRLNFVLDRDVDDDERRARLIRLRIDLRTVQRRTRDAMLALFGPDADYDGRAPEPDDD